jgi:hypothetical protein
MLVACTGRSDERLAIREERVLARTVLRLDRLQSDVAAGAKEIAVRDRGRTEERAAADGASHRRCVSERGGNRQIFSFFDRDDDVAIRDRCSNLLRLDVHALEDAEAVEVALGFEDGGVTEWIALVDVGLLEHDAAVRVGVASHDHLIDCDFRSLRNDIRELRGRLVRADLFARFHLHLSVSAVSVKRLQRDDVGALELWIERIARLERQLRKVLRRYLLIAFDVNVGEQRLRAFDDRCIV